MTASEPIFLILSAALWAVTVGLQLWTTRGLTTNRTGRQWARRLNINHWGALALSVPVAAALIYSMFMFFNGGPAWTSGKSMLSASLMVLVLALCRMGLDTYVHDLKKQSP